MSLPSQIKHDSLQSANGNVILNREGDLPLLSVLILYNIELGSRELVRFISPNFFLSKFLNYCFNSKVLPNLA